MHLKMSLSAFLMSTLFFWRICCCFTRLKSSGSVPIVTFHVDWGLKIFIRLLNVYL